MPRNYFEDIPLRTQIDILEPYALKARARQASVDDCRIVDVGDYQEDMRDFFFEFKKSARERGDGRLFWCGASSFRIALSVLSEYHPIRRLSS